MASSRMRCSSSRSTISLSARRMPRSVTSASFVVACLERGIDDSPCGRLLTRSGHGRHVSAEPIRARARSGRWAGEREDVEFAGGVLAERRDLARPGGSPRAARTARRRALLRPRPARAEVGEQVVAAQGRDRRAPVDVAAGHRVAEGAAVLRDGPGERARSELGRDRRVVDVRALVGVPAEVRARPAGPAAGSRSPRGRSGRRRRSRGRRSHGRTRSATGCAGPWRRCGPWPAPRRRSRRSSLPSRLRESWARSCGSPPLPPSPMPT